MRATSAISETHRSGKHHLPAGLLRNPGFVLLWCAYGVSAMGDHISEMAVLKWLDATHRPDITQLQALITFMFMFPFFLLGPVNGMIADRLPRRGIMIFADLVRAGIMFGFAGLMAYFATGHDNMVQAFVPMLIVGIFAALFSPARAALLPTLIREDQLIRANAMSSGLGVIATMIAVLIGGYLADHYAASVAFHVDAATFIASALLLSLIRIPKQDRPQPASDGHPGGLTEAIRYVRAHRRVLQLILVAVVVWSCGAVVRSTIPAAVSSVFEYRNYTSISSFQARLGFGMLAGALILTALGDALRSQVAITWSLFGLGFSIALLALSILVVAPFSHAMAYHVAGLAVIISGVFGTGVMASYMALLQRIVPNRLQGRVFGLVDLVSMAGLLLATGLLGIPAWGNIDRWIGWILLAVVAIVIGTAIASLYVRLHQSPFPPRVTFWWNVNEFYCKWWFRLKRKGICTVPAEGPVILVANHTCSIDPLLLIASVPYRLLGFLVAEEYTHVPLGRRLMKMTECIAVKRDGQDALATRSAIRHLREGKLLGIFIEGRIRRPGEQIEPKEGAALLALHTNSLVIPVHISGTRYDDSVWRSFWHRHRAVVRFGKPIDLSRHWIPRADKEALTKISRLFLDRIHELASKPERETDD